MAYTITYNSNGGSSIPQTSDATELPNPLPIPTKANHTFLGWYYDSVFTNKAFAGDPLTGNVTLYAKWYLTSSPKIFEVGDVLPQRYITIYRNSSTDSPNISIKSDSDNFNFIYYSSPSWYYINGKKTFIYYYQNGINSVIVNLSSLSVERRTISSVSDNIFSWEDSFANYKSLEKTDIFPPAIIRFRVFSYFQFTTNGYELYTDGGSFTLATGGEDEDVYLNGVKWIDNSFIDVDMRNWSLSKRTIAYANYPGPQSDNIGVWRAFYWEELPPSYSITFEENGGSTVTDLTEQTALPNPLPTPTKSGYVFAGWYYDSTFTNRAFAGDTIVSNVTLYAKWQLNAYTITYNSNGGSSISQTSNATQLPNPLPTPTKSGYLFVNWYYDNALTQIASPGDPIESNVTLYARWHLTTQTNIRIYNGTTWFTLDGYSSYDCLNSLTYVNAPERTIGGTIPNLSSIPTFIVTTLFITYKLMPYQTYKDFISHINNKVEFVIEYFDVDTGLIMTKKFYLAPQSQRELFYARRGGVRTIDGILNITLEFISTNNEV